jgi:ankyrin repeat protein
VSPHSKHSLTVSEIEIWNELIDEGKLEFSPDERPKYLTTSLRNRTCCKTIREDLVYGSSTCQSCGLTLDHRRALIVSTFPGVVPGYDKSLDFYGNTMLHCLAVTAHHPNKLWKMRMMILEGADIQQRNTSGENFLHLLCKNGPRNEEEMKDFIHLLEELSELRFSFQHRDHHGHTFLHILFRHITAHQLSVDSIGQLLLIPQISPYTMDNSGSSILDLLTTKPAIISGTSEFEKPLDYIETLQDRWNLMDKNLDPSYKSDRWVWTTNSGSHWVEAQRKSRFLDYSDDFGDTVLAKILKHEEDPILLKERAKLAIRAGADIEMRDRNGDTALMIAAKRGLRAIVIMLLEEGANVHSRSYNGSGILAQVEMESALAQLGSNDERYAKILSCLPPLLRANAKHNPSEEDEFIILTKNRSNERQFDQLSIHI